MKRYYLSRRLHRLGFDPIKGVQHALGHARDDVARNTYIRTIEEELEHANLPVRYRLGYKCKREGREISRFPVLNLVEPRGFEPLTS